MTCLLCGEGPNAKGAPFGAGIEEGHLHHDVASYVVGYRDVDDPILVTCYEAWTVWGARPGEVRPAHASLESMDLWRRTL